MLSDPVQSHVFILFPCTCFLALPVGGDLPKGVPPYEYRSTLLDASKGGGTKKSPNDGAGKRSSDTRNYSVCCVFVVQAAAAPPLHRNNIHSSASGLHVAGNTRRTNDCYIVEGRVDSNIIATCLPDVPQMRSRDSMQ